MISIDIILIRSDSCLRNYVARQSYLMRRQRIVHVDFSGRTIFILRHTCLYESVILKRDNVYCAIKDAGCKVTDKEMATIQIQRDEFHGEWNYTISPRVASSETIIV